MEINDRIHIQLSLKKKKTFAHKRDLNLLGKKTGRRVDEDQSRSKYDLEYPDLWMRI